METQVIKLHFDGACLNNGKPNAVGGYGVVVECNGEVIKEFYGKLRAGSQTHNRAELESLLIALKYVQDNTVAFKHIELYNDNKALVDCVLGISKRRTNRDIWQEIETVCDELRTSGMLASVYHTNKADLDEADSTYRFNVLADQLAFQGANSLF